VATLPWDFSKNLESYAQAARSGQKSRALVAGERSEEDPRPVTRREAFRTGKLGVCAVSQRCVIEEHADRTLLLF
jgi:hypothetical protein